MGIGPLTPVVFLDRDGVLNEIVMTPDGVSHPPSTIDELRLCNGVEQACAQLRDRGFALVIVTNQPDVVRGTQTREAVDMINAEIARRLSVVALYTCFHDNADACDCRKPQPGMLSRAFAEHDLDPARGYLVGDRWSDVEAGQRVGCRTFLVARSYSGADRCRPDWVVDDLSAAAAIILEQETT